MEWRDGWVLRGALLLALGCGDDAATGGGEPEVGGSGSAAGGDSSAGGAAVMGGASSAGGGSAGGSTSTSMQVPCAPLSNADNPSPTPGVCQGNVAVTCGQDGYLAQEACPSGFACVEYDLSEKRFDGLAAVWVDGRTVGWAGCLPDGAAPCPLEWNGNYFWSTEPPHCDGADQVQCLPKPAPSLFDNYPQLQYGADEGYVRILPCQPGERCAGSDTVDQLTCIDAATPACDGSEPKCTPEGIEHCYGTWESLPGYAAVEPCYQGAVCYEGSDYPFCGAPGEVACDAAASPTVCAPDNGSIVSCSNGFTHHSSCAQCLEDGQNVPCRCDTLVSSTGWGWSPDGLVCSESQTPTCVPQAAADCDPQVDLDVCNGDVAHRCVGHWDDVDCGALGMVCGVGDGVAGCRAPDALACDPGTFQQSCDGDTIVACCGCGWAWILFGPSLPAPCVSGFEVRADCAAWGPYHCDPPANFADLAECVYSP